MEEGRLANLRLGRRRREVTRVGESLAFRKISSYSFDMSRRRSGVLLPLELRILEVGLELQTRDDGFHGFLLADKMAETDDSSALTAHGTLYKALARMTDAGLLDPTWEDPAIAETAGRPRRKLYRVTPEGAVALAASRAAISRSTLTVAKTARGLA